MKNKYLFILSLIMAVSLSSMQGQTYKANTDKTVIWWQGKKIGGEHMGTINLKSAEIEMKFNKPVSGILTIDMNSIVDTDLKDEGMKRKLEDHLRSDDFFSVDKFPEAVFEITGTEKKNGGPIKVSGNITIKGITKPIEFVTSITESDKALIFTAHIDIDRTLFDVRYGSTKFFKNIADRAINDIFSLDYELYLEME